MRPVPVATAVHKPPKGMAIKNNHFSRLKESVGQESKSARPTCSLRPVVSETSAGKRQRLERLADQPLEPQGGLSAPTAGGWLGSPGLLASPPPTAFPGDCFSFLTTQRQGPHSKCPQMGDMLPFVS